MRVAILASGNGSNAEALMNDFALVESIEVILVGSNRRNAGVFERAKIAGVNSCHFTREDLEGGAFLQQLLELKVDWVLLVKPNRLLILKAVVKTLLPRDLHE